MDLPPLLEKLPKELLSFSILCEVPTNLYMLPLLG
jgi:hypothetical protein